MAYVSYACVSEFIELDNVFSDVQPFASRQRSTESSGKD